ncbi:unnamed protein product [Coccothraustes coccothraustes]
MAGDAAGVSPAALHFPPCSAPARAGFRWRVVSGADRNPERGSDPGLAIPGAVHSHGRGKCWEGQVAQTRQPLCYSVPL